MSIAPHVESSVREASGHPGAQVIQLTSAAYLHTHIYPEAPVFTPDSRRFVYARFAALDQPRQYWLCDLTSHCLSPLTDEPSVYGPVVTPGGQFLLYMALDEDDPRNPAVELRRLSLEHPDQGSEALWRREGLRQPYGLGTVSHEGRFYATKVSLPNGSAGILVVDVDARAGRVVHEHPELFNAHPQFEPSASRDLLLQHNRGGVLDSAGRIQRVVGEEGATLYVIEREGTNARPLPIGAPHTPSCQGHQVWQGASGRVLATVTHNFRDASGREGNLLSVAPGEGRPTTVSGDYHFTHVAASPDGRYFVCDVAPAGTIVVGSTATGTTRVFCESGASFGRPQYTHPHPFFSPDLSHILFNSDRTGLAQIYAARVPPGFLDELDP